MSDIWKICPICGKKLFSLNISHVRTHGMTMLEFYEKYPEFKEQQFTYGKKFDNKNTTLFVKSSPHKL